MDIKNVAMDFSVTRRSRAEIMNGVLIREIIRANSHTEEALHKIYDSMACKAKENSKK